MCSYGFQTKDISLKICKIKIQYMVITRCSYERKKPVNDACCLDMQCLQQY